MKIGFIGGGNMGSAMIGGLVAGGVRSDEILVFARSKNEALRAKFGVHVAASEKEVANGADIVVIAVKPAMYENVLKTIKEVVKFDAPDATNLNSNKEHKFSKEGSLFETNESLDEARDVNDGNFNDTNKFKNDINLANPAKPPIILTMAPNFSIQAVRDMLGADMKVVRTMPNTPATIGEGVTAVNFSSNFTADERAAVMKILGCFGKIYELEERLFPVFVGIAGSLPAYVFMFIEALADGAVLEGMTRQKAYEIACESVAGSAKMTGVLLKEGKHPAQLKDEVCSPSGTTIEAVRVLENAKFRAAIIEAVSAAAKKSRGRG